MQTNYILERLNYTPGQNLQIDLNEINLGSYLITSRTYHRLLSKIYVHVLNLCKQIALYLPKSKVYEIEFTLVLKIYNVTTKKYYTVHFGTLPTWKKALYEWIKKYEEGSNLYAEFIYLLAYEKSAV